MISFFSPVFWRAGVSSLEVKYDRFGNGDEGTWQKPLVILKTKQIVDPNISCMSQTSCSRKKQAGQRL